MRGVEGGADQGERAQEEAKPLVKAQETPKELARGGDGLAGALMELEMAL